MDDRAKSRETIARAVLYAATQGWHMQQYIINTRNPSLHLLVWVTHVIIVACPHPLCYTALISLHFGTVIPTLCFYTL